METVKNQSANTVQDNTAHAGLTPDRIKSLLNPSTADQITTELQQLVGVFSLAEVLHYIEEMYIASVELPVDFVSKGPNMWQINAKLKMAICTTLPLLYQLETAKHVETLFAETMATLFAEEWDIEEFGEYFWRMYVDALSSGIMDTYKPNERSELAMIVKRTLDCYTNLHAVWFPLSRLESA